MNPLPDKSEIILIYIVHWVMCEILRKKKTICDYFYRRNYRIFFQSRYFSYVKHNIMYAHEQHNKCKCASTLYQYVTITQLNLQLNFN